MEEALVLVELRPILVGVAVVVVPVVVGVAEPKPYSGGMRI
jgi:hypothetical protein